MIVDAFIEWTFHRDNLELGYAQVEGLRNLRDNLPNFLMIVDHDLVPDIVWHENNCDFLIFCLVEPRDVFDWDMHVVKVLDVGADKSHPIEAHLDIASRCLLSQAIELLRNVFDFVDKVLDENLSVLLLNVAFEVDLDQEVAALWHHLRVLTLDCD